MGALTSKPYAFTARPWELEKSLSLDFFDPLASPIRVDSRGLELMRILPASGHGPVRTWISDKVRFSYDGLRRQRLSSPYVFNSGTLRSFDWADVFLFICVFFLWATSRNYRLFFYSYLGKFVDLDYVTVYRHFLSFFQSSCTTLQVSGSLKASPSADWRSDFFSDKFSDLEKSDFVFFIGSSPRFDSPSLNAVFRTMARKGVPFFSLGSFSNHGYKVTSIGASFDSLFRFLEGRHPLSAVFLRSGRPVFVLGEGFYRSGEFSFFLDQLKGSSIASVSSLFLFPSLGIFNALELGAVPFSRTSPLPSVRFLPSKFHSTYSRIPARLDFFSHSDEWHVFSPRVNFGLLASTVYLGSHADRIAKDSNFVLPATTFLEKSGSTTNTFGVHSSYTFTVSPPEQTRVDWKIISALASVLTVANVPKTLAAVEMLRESVVGTGFSSRLFRPATLSRFFKFSNRFFEFGFSDYFISDSISRSSSLFALRRRKSLSSGNFLDFLSVQLVLKKLNRSVFRMNWNFVYDLVIGLVRILILVVPLLLAVAFMTLAERKVLAGMQRRKGPNVVGFLGLLQPVADGVKLIFKETVFPNVSSKFLFILAPLLTFFLSVVSWAVIPFAEGVVLADLNLGLFYIFAISSLGVYGIVIAGWSSNSRYAFLGSLRSAAQMVSYEVSLGLILISILLCVGSLNFTRIVLFQSHVWFIVPLFPLFFLFFISSLAETNRPPFDLPEAEAELVSGYNVEYSAAGFALFFIGEYANIILMSCLSVILFFGGWLPLPFFPSFPIFWFGIKFLFMLFLFIWVRASFPRYRYDQLMRLGWKVFLPFSLGWLVFVSGFIFSVFY